MKMSKEILYCQAVSHCPNCNTVMQAHILEGEYLGIMICPLCRIMSKEMVAWLKEQLLAKKILECEEKDKRIEKLEEGHADLVDRLDKESTELQSLKEKLTVGNVNKTISEWIEWAEKHWAFKETVARGLETSKGESCSYDVLIKDYLQPKLAQALIKEVKDGR